MKEVYKPVLRTVITLVFGFTLGVTYMTQRATPMSYNGAKKNSKLNKQNPKRRENFFFNHFATQFDLSDEQRKVVENIFEDERARLKQLGKEVKRNYQEVRIEAQNRIRDELEPDQQKIFDQIHQELKVKRKETGLPYDAQP